MLEEMNLAALTQHADSADEFIYLHPDQIDPDPNQDRYDWEAEDTIKHLEETTESVKAQGIRRPLEIRVHPENSDRWLLIAGEVRWRSAQRAGLSQVPCLWRKSIDDKQASLDMLTENLNKKGLKTMELANGLQRRIDEGMTREEIMKATGKSKSWVSKRIKLLGMEPEVIELAEGGLVTDPDNLLSINKMNAEDREKTVQAVQNGKPVSALLSAYKKKKADAGKSSKTDPKVDSDTLEAAGDSQGGDVQSEAGGNDENIVISLDVVKALISKYEPELMDGSDLSEAWNLFVEGAAE